MPKGQTAPDETWIQVRIPRWAREELESLVGREGPSISWVARRLVLDALAARGGAAAGREEDDHGRHTGGNGPR